MSVLLELVKSRNSGPFVKSGSIRSSMASGGGATVHVSRAFRHYPLGDERSELTRRNVRATPSNMLEDRSTPLRAVEIVDAPTGAGSSTNRKPRTTTGPRRGSLKS